MNSSLNVTKSECALISTLLCIKQMGSTMKPTIFDERVAKALHRWQQGAKKNIKKNRQAEGSTTPSPKMPIGPPLCNEGKVDSVHLSPKLNNFHNVHFEASGSSVFSEGHESLKEKVGDNPAQDTNSSLVSEPLASQHQIDIL